MAFFAESQGVRQNMNQFLAGIFNISYVIIYVSLSNYIIFNLDIETKGQNLLDRVNQVEGNVRGNNY